MTVPFLDLRAAHAELRAELDAAIAGVLTSGRFILGDQLEGFEAEFAAYTGTAHCVGVGNGLDALELSLRAVGVGPGDEVIVPGHTFIATWLAVTKVGATIVPVDVDADTFNIAPAAVAGAIGPRTRAIIPVHLYGRPADVAQLRRIIDGREISIIEDAAQAHGAALRGARVGGMGDLAAWSFYPAKNLGALGDGGAVTTNNPELASIVRELRNYGSATKYYHERIGFNSRLDELQAAVLRVKLRHLDEWNARRRRIAETYCQHLADVSVALPVATRDAESVWHLFVVRTEARDALAEHLHRHGVQTQVHYPVPPHRQHAYRDFVEWSLPVSEAMARTVLSLPMGPHLLDEQMTTVIEAMRAFDGSNPYRASSKTVSADET